MSEMIVNPEAYFRGMLPARSALLQALEEEARREEIPIVGPVVGELLMFWRAPRVPPAFWNWEPPPDTPQFSWRKPAPQQGVT